jgi:hypothetical protein
LTTKFSEGGFDLRFASKAAGLCIAETTRDPRQFLRRRLILEVINAGVEFARKSGQFILDMRRPGLYPLENIG